MRLLITLLLSKLREDKDKPLIVALTHTHFDHSGGAHQFESLSSLQGTIDCRVVGHFYQWKIQKILFHFQTVFFQFQTEIKKGKSD